MPELDGKKKGTSLKNLSIISQYNDLQNWKDSVSFGTNMASRYSIFLLLKEG